MTVLASEAGASEYLSGLVVKATEWTTKNSLDFGDYGWLLTESSSGNATTEACPSDRRRYMVIGTRYRNLVLGATSLVIPSMVDEAAQQSFTLALAQAMLNHAENVEADVPAPTDQPTPSVTTFSGDLTRFIPPLSDITSVPGWVTEAPVSYVPEDLPAIYADTAIIDAYLNAGFVQSSSITYKQAECNDNYRQFGFTVEEFNIDTIGTYYDYLKNLYSTSENLILIEPTHIETMYEFVDILCPGKSERVLVVDEFLYNLRVIIVSAAITDKVSFEEQQSFTGGFLVDLVAQRINAELP